MIYENDMLSYFRGFYSKNSSIDKTILTFYIYESLEEVLSKWRSNNRISFTTQ
jgi:hypothetical protein